MAELPTEEQLEMLYHEKGEDALAWYVWRNILRATPIIGRCSLHDHWFDKAKENCFYLARSLVFLKKSYKRT